MPGADEFRIILHKEGEHEHTDVHPVVIGIGRHHNPVVAQVSHVVLHSESVQQQVQLLVLRHLLAALLVAVDRLSAEAEHRLRLRVACLGDCTARGVTLGDEYAREVNLFLVLLGDLVSQMQLAVAQLAVIDIRPLVAFAGLLLNPRNLLAFGLRCDDFSLNHRDYVLVYMEIVVEIRLYEIVDESPDCGAPLDSVRSVGLLDRIAVFVQNLLLVGVGRAELRLGLPFEIRLLYADADCSYDSLPDVLRSVVLLVELLESLCDGFPECRQMRSPVAGVLSVHERRDVLPVGVAVGEHDFDVLPFEMDRRVERLFGKIVVHDVEKSVLGDVRRTVQRDGQPLVEVAVVLDHLLDELHIEAEVPEHVHIRHEAHKRSVLLLRPRIVPVSDLLLNPSPFESGARHPSVAVGFDVEI